MSSRAGSFRSDERGQVLIIVAGALVVLLVTVAVAIDWGYGLTQRRVMQNAADAGALAAGRLLVKIVLPGPRFAVTENQLLCEALDYVRSNEENFGTVVSDPKARPTDLRVQWADVSKSPYHDLVAYSSWPPAPPGIDCSTASSGSLDRNGGPTVNAAARFIRVETSTMYRAVFAHSDVPAGASATVSIHGADPKGAPIWPITRHYTRDIFNQGSCGSPCQPANATPVTFWSSGGGNDVDYGAFHGLTDYSRYSPIIASGKPSCYPALPPPPPPLPAPPPPLWCQSQLIEHWDDSGPPPNGRPSLAYLGQANPPFPSNANVTCNPDKAKWVTWGDDLTANGNVDGNDTSCSLPNWGTKPFAQDPNDINTGRLRLDVPRGPVVDSTRVVCTPRPPARLPSPSCDDPRKGDWVETQGGNLGEKMSGPMLAYIRAYGLTDPVWSNAKCEQCGGSTKPTYGKYVVLQAWLWDCAQSAGALPLNPNSGTWTLVQGKKTPSDCSDVHSNGDLGDGQSVSRVHLFTVAPFTFFEGLITSGPSSSIQGFWGGSISNDPNGGALNQFSNAVNIVD